MIAITAVLSTSPPLMFRALTGLLLAVLLLGGCAVPRPPQIERPGAPPETSGYFTMTDGTQAALPRLDAGPGAARGGAGAARHERQPGRLGISRA